MCVVRRAGIVKRVAANIRSIDRAVFVESWHRMLAFRLLGEVSLFQ